MRYLVLAVGLLVAIVVGILVEVVVGVRDVFGLVRVMFGFKCSLVRFVATTLGLLFLLPVVVSVLGLCWSSLLAAAFRLLLLFSLFGSDWLLTL